MSVPSLLGFAQRAGRVISGSTAVERALLGERARLVILAEDASKRVEKRIVELTDQGKAPLAVWGTKAVLGQALGKPDRAVVAICDTGFARALQKVLVGGGIEKG